MRKRLFVKGIVGLAVALNAVGFLVGQYNSPNYGDQFGSMAYLFSNSTYTVSNNGLEFLEIDAGPYKYKYDVVSNNLEWELRDTQSISLLQRPRSRIYEAGRFAEWLGLNAVVPVSAGAAAVVLKQSFDEPPLLKLARGSSGSISRKALLVLAIAAGAGYGGYWLGYEDVADWENETFVAVLQNPQYYQRLARDFLECSAMMEEKSYDHYDYYEESIQRFEEYNEINYSFNHPSIHVVLTEEEVINDVPAKVAAGSKTVEVDKDFDVGVGLSVEHIEKLLELDIDASQDLFAETSVAEITGLDRALEKSRRSLAKIAFCEALIDYALDPTSDNPFAAMH